jgi:hypothetical protein
MKRTTVFIDESIEADLRALARRQQRPVAALVREAVEQYVVAGRQAGPARPGFVAIGRSGFGDTAERHEEMLFADLAPHGGTGAGRTQPAPKGRRASGRSARSRR